GCLGPGGLNWTAEETQVLLCAWSDERVQKSLAENLRNRHVFKHLSGRMSEMGFSRSPHQCRLRVKTLKANYVRAKLQKSVDSSQPCTFKYFAEMEAVLGRRSAGGEEGPHFVSPEGTAETAKKKKKEICAFLCSCQL
uniref:Myb/SANT-like DNA-binding domain-containing protein n=1 Tax=Stegastes partitus TaxID=144197 RepID=A0A3B5B690_9TELE